MRRFRFDYEKILESRKSRAARKKIPFDNFLEKYNSVTNLFDEVHKKFRKNELLQECRKQDIIGIMTAFEVYFKDVISYLIQKQKLDVNRLFVKEDQIRILDLENIIKAKIKLSDLIHLKYNFMKLSDIDQIFRRTLNIQIFEQLKKFSFRIDKTGFHSIKITERRKDDFYLDKDYYAGIEALIRKRNSFVHDTNPALKISKADVEAANESIFEFVFFFDIFLYFYFKEKVFL